MKRIFFYICVVVALENNAQQNLVPNPSFEDTVFCPWAEAQMPVNWLLFGNSADYYHSCSSALNVPNTPTGFHPANAGEAMIGLFTYVNPNDPSWPNYREFVGAELLNPLTIGQKYFISFYLSFARIYPTGFNAIGADKLGMKFSTISFSETSPPALTNTAHLFTDSIYTDTTLWIKVTGSFIADSTYNYVMLGNFFDESQTDTLYFGGSANWATASYYFIDDICVSTDSLYNETWIGMGEPVSEISELVAYPNPANDFVRVMYPEPIQEVSLINKLGQIIYQIKFNNINYGVEFSVNGFPAGVYLIRIKANDKYYLYNFLINH